MLILAMASGLLLLEPDFGAAAVLLMTGLGLIFLGGVRFGQFLLFLIGTLCIMGLLAVSSPYRLARITSFLDPWADPFNSGFQLTQSLIAIGSGGWFGAGLGGSVQKLFYLPEAHTDFLFAIFADQAFGAYLAYGVGLLITLQAAINIGVNMGALPTKGLTLPFVSYGGNSILSMSFAVGLVLRLCRLSVMAAIQSSACRSRSAWCCGFTSNAPRPAELVLDAGMHGWAHETRRATTYPTTHPGDGWRYRRPCIPGTGGRRVFARAR